MILYLCMCVRDTLKYKSRLVFMGLKSTLAILTADTCICVCVFVSVSYSQFSIRYKHVHCVHMDVSLPLNN